MTHATALMEIQNALDDLARGTGTVQALSDRARGQQALLQALPARYAEVLHGLLDRLESSALFSEESCSFSQKDLIASLQLWLDKARTTLDLPTG
jgi:hypothetical protein